MADARYPSVRLGEADPGKMHSYNKTSVDGIEVYYLDRLPEFFTAITVKIEKLFFFKKLVAKGKTF